MILLSDVAAELIAAGVKGDALVAALRRVELASKAAIATEPPKRSAAALRQERYRRNKASRVMSGDACDVTNRNGDAPREHGASANTEPKNLDISNPPKEPLTGFQKVPVEKQKSKRATRLPADWQPSAKNRADALEAGCPESMIQRMGNGFRDYWVAKPGKDGVKLDWDATWRNWARREAERRGWAPELRQDNPPDEVDGRVHVMQDTPEWEAWKPHRKGKATVDARGGWWFPSRWPPGHPNSRKAPAEEPTPDSGMF